MCHVCAVRNLPASTASNCPVNDGVKCQGSEPSHTAQGWSRILMRHARDDMHAGAA